MGLSKAERESKILLMLAATNGSVRAAAELAKIPKGTLYKALREMGFTP